MQQASTPPARKPGVLGVAIDPRSYTNILYLLLGLPLGTAYFVFLVTGLSVGAGMIVTLAGIPILILTLIGSRGLCLFEWWLTETMLGTAIPEYHLIPLSGGMWERLKALLTDRVTWSGVVYLLLRFPLGIATFTIAVTLVSVSIGLTFAPAYMWTTDPWTAGDWRFDPFPWSWLATLIGLPLVLLSLHVMNGMAEWSGELARVMLARLGSRHAQA